MSAFALAKRIGKIQNKAKMESLVQVRMYCQHVRYIA